VSRSDLLLPLTPLYGAAVRARAALYRNGWLRPVRFEVPVISVGNLTFGGTGKTPTVIALVRDLIRRGRRPAVLTRGYGRRTRDPVVVIGPEPAFGPDRTGDEPLEMASRLPGVPVVVDADRVRGGRQAIRMGATILVLDDGFQQLGIGRDLDLVLIDAGDPWGGGRLPPRGRLREPVSALRRASAVLITKLRTDLDSVREDVIGRVRSVSADLPILGARTAATRVRTPDGWRPTAILEGRRVLAFAGIARPQAFRDLLASCGAVVVATRWLDDHHRYRPDEIDRLLVEARNRDAVPITTAKDAVKLPAASPVWVAEAESIPTAGDWERLWQLLPGGPV